MSNQIRQAAVSIPSNIAEGYGRETNAETRRFMVIALGSAKEVEYQLLLARDLSYLATRKYELLNAQVKEIQKMLHGFMRSFR